MLTIPVSGALAAKYIRQVASGGITARSETCIVVVMLKTLFIFGVTYLIEIMSTALGSGPTASRPLSWSKAKSVTCSPAGPGCIACGVTPPSGGGVTPGTAKGCAGRDEPCLRRGKLRHFVEGPVCCRVR